MDVGAKGANVSNLVPLGQFVSDLLNCFFIIANDHQVAHVEQKKHDLVALKFVVEVSIDRVFVKSKWIRRVHQ